jgi:hypothetical protein
MTAPDTALTEHSRALWVIAAIAIVICYFWQSAALIPLKILVVFFHESSHALATILSGGKVLSMQVDPQQGGAVQSLGGWPFLIVSAGYLGSLVIGALLLVLAAHSKHDRWILAALGLMMLVLTVVYVRNGFGLFFGLSGALILIGMAAWLPAAISDFALKLIGIVSMLYVPLDIISDTLERSHLHSDARILAELTFGGPRLWGLLWLAISAAVILLSLYLVVARGKKQLRSLPSAT